MCYKINCQCETVELLGCPSKDKAMLHADTIFKLFYIQKVVSDNILAIYMSHESLIVTATLA